MELDDLDRPPVSALAVPEPSMDGFLVRLGAVVTGTLVLVVLLSVALPRVGAALALVVGVVGGAVLLRGRVPRRAEGYLVAAGLTLSCLLLIPS